MGKKLRMFAALISFIAVILTFYPAQVLAFDTPKHTDLMVDLLFKGFKDNVEDTNEIEINLLGFACYLVLDQCNNHGQDKLDYLANNGVSGIPLSVSDINFNANSITHRTTHRGWDEEQILPVAKEVWPIRQQILLNTVSTVFVFESDNQAECFCELLYYIHIIGDYLETAERIDDNKIQGYKKSQYIIEVGGTVDRINIIDKLLELLPIVFYDQTHSEQYLNLESNLRELNAAFQEIVRSMGGIDNKDELLLYSLYIHSLCEALSASLPEMLKKEQFFADVFYPGEWRPNWRFDVVAA